MISLVRKSPIASQETHLQIAGESHPVRAYQIIVWVSLKLRDSLTPPIPAV
jgi:hypothetical protein